LAQQHTLSVGRSVGQSEREGLAALEILVCLSVCPKLGQKQVRIWASVAKTKLDLGPGGIVERQCELRIEKQESGAMKKSTPKKTFGSKSIAASQGSTAGWCSKNKKAEYRNVATQNRKAAANRTVQGRPGLSLGS
jgi:hypothetical protein